jgi:protein TonB
MTPKANIWPFVVMGSLLIHGSGLIVFSAASDRNKHQRMEKITVKVSVPEPQDLVEQEQTPPAEPAEPTPPPPKSPPKKKIEPKPTPVASKPSSEPNDNVAPIQGLSQNSFDPSGKSGFAAPVGNTLMVEDQGIRKTEVNEYTADLSADAKLIAGSLAVPEYTDEALDAGIEGAFQIDVYVDENGKIVDIDLPKKVGFGMDSRIIDSVKKAEFVPRKNKWGKPMAGWTTIRFRLTIP